MGTVRATSAAERMQALRRGGRRAAAHSVAATVTGFEFGPDALPGLEEDLFASRLSLSDLEELALTLLDHVRQPQVHSAAEEVSIEVDKASVSRAMRVPEGSLWKFNVAPQNLPVCIKHSLFADDKQRYLVRGDLLLLQQTKSPSVDPHRRITHVMQFDRYELDREGLSERLWGKQFQYLLHGRVHRLQQSFSLEDLSLSKSYSQQGKIAHERIAPEDEQAVLDAIGPLAL